MIPDGAMVGFSGFTPAGAAKAVPRALAARAEQMHERGQSMQIRVLTGASTGAALDDALAEAAHRWRPAGSHVRFVADVSTVERWSDAKDPQAAPPELAT